jgi:sugar transferase (PEP-CTERM system associated)
MLRLFRHYLSTQALILFGVECGVTLIVVYFGLTRYLAKYSGRFVYGPSQTIAIAMLTAAIAGVLVSLGIYDRWNLTDRRQIAQRLPVAFVLCFPIVWIIVYLHLERASVVALPVIAACAAMTLIPLLGVMVSRVVYARVVGLAGLRHRVLVLGAGSLAARIERFSDNRRGRAFAVVGYVAIAGASRDITPERIVGEAAVNPLPGLVRSLGADEIVVAVDDRRSVPLDSLLECRLSGIAVSEFLTFWEREGRQLCLDALEPSWLIYAEGFAVGSVATHVLKRGFDLATTVLLGTILLPVIALAAVAVRLDSAGPVLYAQERVGRNGRIFVLYKFRSMRADAEADGRPRWAATDDPRVTRVGAFLRKTRIDELPQLLNVLKGDMSFVGPRPERPFFVEILSRDIPFYRERFRVRPGLTGWAQINYPYGASVEDAREKVAYDLYYIKNYSLMLDFLVLLGTAQIVFWPKAAD